VEQRSDFGRSPTRLVYKIFPREGHLTTPLKAGHILVVDDDRAIRDVIAELLQDQGYDVSVAENGAQALDVLRLRPTPDLIFLDLQMPVMDGIEFARQKDRDQELSRVPVCVMTAFRDSASIPAGVAVVLRKPLGSADLLSLAKRFCPEQ
jgi:CheY-like chemotaxis protein